MAPHRLQSTFLGIVTMDGTGPRWHSGRMVSQRDAGMCPRLCGQAEARSLDFNPRFLSAAPTMEIRSQNGVFTWSLVDRAVSQVHPARFCQAKISRTHIWGSRPGASTISLLPLDSSLATFSLQSAWANLSVVLCSLLLLHVLRATCPLPSPGCPLPALQSLAAIPMSQRPPCDLGHWMVCLAPAHVLPLRMFFLSQVDL